MTDTLRLRALKEFKQTKHLSTTHLTHISAKFFKISWLFLVVRCFCPKNLKNIEDFRLRQFLKVFEKVTTDLWGF